MGAPQRAVRGNNLSKVIFGLAHLDRKIIAGLERVIDRPLVETSHTKYITSRSGKSTTRIIGGAEPAASTTKPKQASGARRGEHKSNAASEAPGASDRRPGFGHGRPMSRAQQNSSSG